MKIGVKITLLVLFIGFVAVASYTANVLWGIGK